MSSGEALESLVCVSLCVTFPSKRIPHLPFQSFSSTIFSVWDAFPKTIAANQLAMDNWPNNQQSCYVTMHMVLGNTPLAN